MDTEKQKQHRRDDLRLKRQKRAAIRGAYRVTNQQRMVARRALELIGTSKAWLVLDMKYQTCFLGGRGDSKD